MQNDGFVTFHRKITQWEWYTDVPTKTLFFHLVLMANYEDKKWKGQIIKRGERVTSLSHIAKETGLTVRSIRTSLNKLKMTHEVTYTSTNKNTKIFVVKYDEYQTKKDRLTSKLTSKLTNERQTTDKQLTTNNNDNKDNNDNNNKYIATPNVASLDVNKVLEAFQMKLNPSIEYGNKTQRKATEWMIEHWTLEKVLRTIDYLETIRGETYAPIITTPYQLKEKFAQLMAYNEKQKTKQVIIRSV